MANSTQMGLGRLGLEAAFALAAVGALSVSMAGCNHRNLQFLGHWTGGFVLQGDKNPAKGPQMTVNGYIQLYQYDGKVKMEVENSVQTFDLTGVWKADGPRRIEIRATDIQVDQPPMDVLTASGRPFIPVEAFKKDMTVPFALDLTPDKLRLTGLLMHIGPLEGAFAFNRVGPSAGR